VFVATCLDWCSQFWCPWTLASPLGSGLAGQGIDRLLQALIAYLFIIITSDQLPRCRIMPVIRRLLPSAEPVTAVSLIARLHSVLSLVAGPAACNLLVAECHLSTLPAVPWLRHFSTGALQGTLGVLQCGRECQLKLQRVGKLVQSLFRRFLSWNSHHGSIVGKVGSGFACS